MDYEGKMIQDLVKLADYLDQKNMLREANVVDVFITRIAQIDPDFKATPNFSDPTWHDDQTGNSQDSEPKKIENPMGSIDLGNGVKIDLTQHPLGQKIINYMKKVFTASDSGTIPEIKDNPTEMQELISSKDIYNLIQTAFKYGENLEPYQGQGKNPTPLSPAQFRLVLFEAMRLYSRIYQTKGSLDGGEIRELVHNVYKHYEDSYIDDYLGEDYQVPYRTTSGEAPAVVPSNRELSPEQKADLWKRNDEMLYNDFNETWMEQVERDNNPELHRQKQDRLKNKLKGEYPEEMHSVLFGE